MTTEAAAAVPSSQERPAGALARLRPLVLPASAWLLVALLIGLTRLVSRGGLKTNPSAFQILCPLIVWIWCIAIGVPAARWIRKHIASTPAAIAAHAAVILFLSVSQTQLQVLLMAPHQLHPLGVHCLVKLIFDAAIYTSIIAVASAFHSQRLLEESELRTARMERELERARSEAAFAPLPPGLIGDAFDALAKRIGSNTRSAITLLQLMADFFRHLLAAVAAERWPVAKEAELIWAYCDLQRHLGLHTEISLEVDSDIVPLTIPAGEIQRFLVRAAATATDTLNVRLTRGDMPHTVRVEIRRHDEVISRHDTTDHPPEASRDELSGLPLARSAPRPQFAAPLLGFAAFVLATAYLSLELVEHAGGVSLAGVGVNALRALLWISAAATAFPIVRRLRSGLPQTAGLIAGGVIGGLAAEAAFITLHNVLSGAELMPPFTADSARIVLHGLAAPLLLIFALLNVAVATSVRRRGFESHLRVVNLQRELASAQLELLESQLHPHFLFNALNSVGMLVRTDRDGALEMLARLRAFYASVRSHGSAAVITVGEELELVDDYLAIERIRFGSRLEIDVHIDDDAAGVHVPTLLLQPIVENAIKHGVSRHRGPASIRITARAHDQRLTIRVENSGAAPDASRNGGAQLGLTNTRRRLRTLFGEACELRIEALAAGGTAVIIDAPAAAP